MAGMDTPATSISKVPESIQSRVTPSSWSTYPMARQVPKVWPYIPDVVRPTNTPLQWIGSSW